MRTPVEALLLGIRPEDVMIGGEGISARVTNVEFLGADTVVACAVGDQFVTARVLGQGRVEARRERSSRIGAPTPCISSTPRAEGVATTWR